MCALAQKVSSPLCVLAATHTLKFLNFKLRLSKLALSKLFFINFKFPKELILFGLSFFR
jgi:hypothetical protein